MEPTLQIRTLKRFLFGLISVLIICHVIGQFSAHILGYRRLLGFVATFRLQSEHNIPSYISGLLLASAAGLLLLIGVNAKQHGHKPVLPWFGLCILFMYLSFDEITLLHEHYWVLGDQMEMFDFLKYKWVVMGSLSVLAVVALFFHFWLNLPRATRFWFATSAVVFVGGAIGFETISGLYSKGQHEGFGFSMLIVLEEGMEMAGVAIFITALARYIHDQFGGHCGVHLRDDPLSKSEPTPSTPPTP